MRCFICEIDDPDRGKFMKCDSCSRNLHKECSGLNSAEVKIMELRSKRSLKFYCDDCSSGFQQVPKLLKMVDELKVQLDSIKVKLENISVQNSNSNTEFEMDAVIEELYDRQKRANNIIIFNLQENPTSAADIDSIKEVLSDIVPDPITVLSASRMGRANKNGNRALKVTLSNNETVMNIIKNRSRMKRERKVFINVDLTPSQRDKYRKLEEQLKQRIHNGEQNLVIKYVRGVPQIITRKN